MSKNKEKQEGEKNYVELIRQEVIEKTDLRSEERQLIDLYSLLALIKPGQVTMKDVHDAWSVWMNNKNPEHKSLIYFERLTKEVQLLDREYMEAINLIKPKQP